MTKSPFIRAVFLILVINSISKCDITFFSHFFSGLSFHNASIVNLKFQNYQYKLANVQFSSRSLEQPLYYDISFGSYFRLKNRQIRFSLEFIHDKSYVREKELVKVKESNNPAFEKDNSYQFDQFLDSFSMSHGLNYLLLKLNFPVFSPEVWNKPFNLNLGLGGGLLIPHVESKKQDQSVEKYQLKGPAFISEIMAEWQLIKYIHMFTGIKFSGVWVNDATIVDGFISNRNWSWHFIFGIGIEKTFPKSKMAILKNAYM